jgi:tricorn protease
MAIDTRAVRVTALLLALVGRPLPAQLRPVVRAPRVPLAEPAIAPDRGEIAFVSGGDIWVVPSAGGEARLLVSHPANESRPIYSPDGARLAFMSNRAGSMDIWLLTFATGELRRLTYDDGTEQLDGWSRDAKWVYFSTNAHDASSTTDEFRVRAEGGTPMPVSADRYASEFMGAPSPDGSATAIVGRGFSQSQWWRKGSSHLDKSELWLVRVDGSAAPTYEQLTKRDAKQQWPMWSPDGATLYFVSDRSGAQNIWAKPLRPQGEPRAITNFRDERVMWPTISADGKTIVFERDFGVWSLDVASGQAKHVPITLRGASAGEPAEHLTLTTFQEMALSPDGKKVAFVARGEVFAASSADGGDAVRLTTTPSIEAQLAWAPDSRRIAYASNRDGAWHVYRTCTCTTFPPTPKRSSPAATRVTCPRDGRRTAGRSLGFAMPVSCTSWTWRRGERASEFSRRATSDARPSSHSATSSGRPTDAGSHMVPAVRSSSSMRTSSRWLHPTLRTEAPRGK